MYLVNNMLLQNIHLIIILLSVTQLTISMNNDKILLKKGTYLLF